MTTEQVAKRYYELIQMGQYEQIVAVFEVRDGKIVKEQFFYDDFAVTL